MKHKTRILVPYASYGSGHKTTAEYIKRYFEEMGEYECLAIDLVPYLTRFFGTISQKASDTLMTKMPDIWTVLYHLSNNKVGAALFEDFNVYLLKREDLKKKIEDFSPELTIATHFLGSDLILSYNKEGWTDSKVVTIVTDYYTHAFWKRSLKADAIILSDNSEKKRLIQEGFSKKQLFVTGIPIPEDYGEGRDVLKIKRRFQVDNGKKTVLFFGGGGNGAMANLKYLKALMKAGYDCNVIFVAGRNEKAKEQAEDYKKIYHGTNILVMGFVQPEDLYAISDFVVTKPGGLQITECLKVGKPMLLVDGNGGQEVENRKFLLENGYARAVKWRKTSSFKRQFKEMLENEKVLTGMQKKIAGRSQHTAIKELVKIVEELLSEPREVR